MQNTADNVYSVLPAQKAIGQIPRAKRAPIIPIPPAVVSDTFDQSDSEINWDSMSVGSVSSVQSDWSINTDCTIDSTYSISSVETADLPSVSECESDCGSESDIEECPDMPDNGAVVKTIQTIQNL